MLTIQFIARLADSSDALAYVAGCLQLGKVLGYFPYDRAEPTGDERCMLAVSEFGTPVGFATYFEPEGDHYRGCIFIDLVWVEKSHRRMGVGQALLERLIAQAGEDPRITRFELGTLPENAAMHALGERVGLKPFVTYYRMPAVR